MKKNESQQPSPTHGGSRKGAGRPRLLTGARKRSLYVTDDELTDIHEFIAIRRSQEEPYILAAIKVLLKKLREGKHK